MKIICFDIDGVICLTKKKDYKNAKPLKSNIKTINYLYKKNFYIKLYTARGMGKFNGNIKLVQKAYFELTKKQMERWGVKYHELNLGKTSYDLIIDDRALFFKKSWKNELLKKLKIKK